MLLLEPRQPLRLFRAVQVWRSPLGEGEEVGRVPRPQRLLLPTLRQPLARIRMDRLQRDEARLAPDPFRDAQQALAHQAVQHIQHVPLAVARADRLDRREGAPPP